MFVVLTAVETLYFIREKIMESVQIGKDRKLLRKQLSQ